MKTYTKEQIVEAFKSALPNSTALGRLLTHLESLCGARNTSSGCSEVACTRTVGHTDTIPNVAQERHYNHERRVNWPAFKPGDHIRWPLSDHGWGYGVVKEPSPQLPDYWDIYIDGPKALCCFLHTSQLKLIPAQFKAGDRVRLVRTDGLGKLEFEFANKVGCIVSAGDISNGRRQLLTVRFDGKIRSFFAWRFDVVPESKFKPGDRVRLDKGEWNVPSGTVGTVMSTSLDDLEEVDFQPVAPSILVPRNRLRLVESQFKVGDRVRIENCPGSLQGKLGYIHKVVDEWNYIVRRDDGLLRSVHASWLKSAPQFKDGQRVRVRVTGQAGRISGTNPAGDVLEVKYEGTSSIGLYKVEGLEPAPFKVGDRVRWRFGSSLPFCYGQVKYLSNERAGVRIDGQVVEVVEWLLEAEPLSVGDRVRRKSDNAWSGVVPLDPANYQAAKPQFKAGDRVRWKDTTQMGTVLGVLAFGKVNVALDKGGWLNNYSPDGFELLGPAEPRTFIKHFLERVRGQEFTHEEAELLRTHIAIRERTPKPTELRCPFCGGTGSLSRNGNLWRLECIGCGAEVTAAANEDCKSKWGRRS